MPRPTKFDENTILDAALRVVSRDGPVALTAEAIAREMGGHVGSIYYRFPTMDHLLATLWIHCARAGQDGMLRALSIDDLDSAVEAAALHYPRWARTDVDQARVLAVYGREQVSPRWPSELDRDLAGVNDALAAAVVAFTRRWYGDASAAHRRAAMFALLDIPATAIRRYLLVGKRPPVSLDPVVLAASRAALEAAAAPAG